MGERKFLIEENQKIWDVYYNQNLELWNLENKTKLESLQWTDEEKIIHGKKLWGYNMPLDKITPYNYEYIKKKQSLQQYKPILFKFEEYVKKAFHDATVNDIEEFQVIVKNENNLRKLNAFMIHCVSNEIIQNKDKEFLISLLPAPYRKIGKLLMDNG